MNRIVELRRFRCVDADGKQHVVIEYQEMIESRSMQGASELPGMKFLRDSRSREVNAKDEATFEILATGQVLRKL